MRQKRIKLLFALAVATISWPALLPLPHDASAAGSVNVKASTKQLIEARYKDVHPTAWGERIPGVLTTLNTKEKVIALTFDACGGKKGNGYDKKLIDFLTLHHIPATLFLNARWIDANPTTFQKLAANPLFEIENHGYSHRPLSVTGRTVYGIRGTTSVGAAFDEVNENEDKIAKLTGRRPRFFRSGTAYYDDVAIHVVQDSGLKAVNFSVIGDAGATYNAKQVKQAFLSAHSGSIIIAHMNQPDKETAEGVMAAIPVLLKRGYRFVHLEDYPLQ